jgi:hypothetical protein
MKPLPIYRQVHADAGVRGNGGQRLSIDYPGCREQAERDERSEVEVGA